MQRRNQKGCIVISKGKWALRWRESVRDEKGERRPLRFKILGEVTPEHRRNKDRKTGKLRVPAAIQGQADLLMRPLNPDPQTGFALAQSVSIGVLVDKEYFPDIEKHKKPSTMKGYRDIWRIHLKQRLASKMLREFQRVDAHNLWKEIAADNPALTGRTMQHIKAFLSGVFHWAIDRGLYPGSKFDNPAYAALPEGLPKGKPTGAYTVEEVEKVLKLLVHPRDRAIVAAAFGGGLRKGEISALDWMDYVRGEDGAIIRVRRSYWRGHTTSPKTERSEDIVKLDPELCQYIDSFREFCGGVTEGLMFSNVKKKPLDLDTFAHRHLKPVFKGAGIEWKGWHAFRRGNATYLAKKLHSRAAALSLRHAGTTVTEEHYIKNTKQERRALEAKKEIERGEMRDQAAGTLGAAFRKESVN